MFKPYIVVLAPLHGMRLAQQHKHAWRILNTWPQAARPCTLFVQQRARRWSAPRTASDPRCEGNRKMAGKAGPDKGRHPFSKIHDSIDSTDRGREQPCVLSAQAGSHLSIRLNFAA
jgi:hypothetical protein